MAKEKTKKSKFHGVGGSYLISAPGKDPVKVAGTVDQTPADQAPTPENPVKKKSLKKQ